MIWRWLICFSLGASCALPAQVSGTVKLADSLDPAVRKNHDYSGVVVWLEPSGPGPARAAKSPRAARMVQKGKRFIPHVLAIPAGTPVAFPNLDPIFHSAFSNFNGQVFDLGLYAPNTSRTITFTRPGIVHVFCNIHPSMSAVIVVLNQPWFAVSNTIGAFEISDVPPGEYEFHLFHERAAASTLAELTRKISVTPQGVALAPISISETGYVEAPHKNKYGHEYPPVVDETGLYPAKQK